MILPKYLDVSDNIVSIKYAYINDKELCKDFYDDMEYCILNDYNADKTEMHGPDFFIFHKSRCGSTLLCNLIKNVSDYVVINEPQILLQCMQLNVENEMKKMIMRKIVCEFARECSKIIIKLTSYSILFKEMLGDIFPNTKTVYITRNTLEVLKSNILKPTATIRGNNLSVVKGFASINEDTHFLGYIFEMDKLGEMCNYVLDYDKDLNKISIKDKLQYVFGIKMDNCKTAIIEKQFSLYSKGEQKVSYKVKGVNGISMYEEVIGEELIRKIIRMIDDRSYDVDIEIKRCKSLTIFESRFWENFPQNAIQKGLNDEYEGEFEKVKEIIYENLTKYCEEYEHFYKSIIYSKKWKSCDVRKSLEDNTDLVSINFTKYEINKHQCDYWHSENSTTTLNESTRKVAFIIYLNDVNDGGETEFYHQDVKIKPKKGRLVMFSPDWLCTHKGNMPISDDKYIITGWIHSKIVVDGKLCRHYEGNIISNALSKEP